MSWLLSQEFIRLTPTSSSPSCALLCESSAGFDPPFSLPSVRRINSAYRLLLCLFVSRTASLNVSLVTDASSIAFVGSNLSLSATRKSRLRDSPSTLIPRATNACLRSAAAHSAGLCTDKNAPKLRPPMGNCPHTRTSLSDIPRFIPIVVMVERSAVVVLFVICR